jgi:hypothetical protein
VPGEQVSTLPIVAALAVGVVCFFAFLPFVVRDSRRPLPPPPAPKPVRVREPRAVRRALRQRAEPPRALTPVRPELGRRLALVATAVVALSLWSSWSGRSHSARR